MNERERFLETLLFGKPDRIPFSPGGPRESTLAAWRTQGLPDDADWFRHLCGVLGVELPPAQPRRAVWLRHTMIPEFEEKVLEEREDTLIVQDWKGNVCEISRRYDVSYLRSAKDFVTRRWIRCPVETWADWEEMKGRYDPDDPSRLPEDLPSLGKDLADRDYPVGVSVHGPFWQMREWMGFEGLCIAFKEQPDLIRDMVRFWTDYIARLLERLLSAVPLDYMHISEDMAFKSKPMIGPEMCREFLAPCWATWGDILRAHDVPVYDVDSDGYVGDLIPVWIECGLNVCDPIEVAAGNDIVALRERFGRSMAFRGGVDKRCMAAGGAELEAEMDRIEPVVRSGGYIPGCDHGIPPDVSWPNMVAYSRRLARMTGWL